MYKSNLPPNLREELDAAEKEAGQAITDYEDLTRDHVLLKEIFLEIFWLMVEGVEVKQSDTVNGLFKQIAESVEVGRGWPREPYGVIRDFYRNGAKDADRRRVAKALGENRLFQYAKKYLRKNDTQVLDVKTIEELHRKYTEARRRLEENGPAIKAAWNRIRETDAKLAALKAKAREIEKANGLSGEVKALLEKIDAYRKRAERLEKEAPEIERETMRLNRIIERAGDTAPPPAPDAGSSESPPKAGGASKPRARARFTREVEKGEKKPKTTRKTIPRLLWEEQ